jgi:hypothetical protein
MRTNHCEETRIGALRNRPATVSRSYKIETGWSRRVAYVIPKMQRRRLLRRRLSEKIP